MEDKKTEIFNCGKDLFCIRGFKNTNVSDITKMAGIAVGTFYNYYSSKEKLFMDIYIKENEQLKKNIMQSVDIDEEPLKLMKQLLILNNSGMSSNPILKEWYNKDVFNKIEQVYREENGNDAVNFLYASLAMMVEKWQKEGKMRNDIDGELIMALFAAIINIDTHKEEIGLSYFPKLMDYLGEFVMKGLLK